MTDGDIRKGDSDTLILTDEQVYKERHDWYHLAKPL